jgi:hypothetical protein
VPHLLDVIEIKTGKRGRPAKKLRMIVAGKGYDSEELRNFFWAEGFRRRFQERRMRNINDGGQSS